MTEPTEPTPSTEPAELPQPTDPTQPAGAAQPAEAAAPFGVVDLGAYGEQFTRDPYPLYAELRSRGPAHFVRLAPPYQEMYTWLIVGYEEARAALTDPRLVKHPSALDGSGFEGDPIGTHLLLADPPQHTRLRKLVAREFTARRVQALAPRVQEIAEELLDAMGERGRTNLIDAYAFPLPLTVICELLGVPAMDREAFRAMSNEVVAPTGVEEEMAAVTRLAAYLDELIEDKRCTAPADDLLSALIRTTAEDGDQLSADELRAMAFLLLIAGHETTVNLIGNAVHALLARPGELAAVRADFGRIDAVIEETLRHEGPVENATYRFTAEPVTVGEVTIPAGHAVLVSLAAAGHDPARYPDPGRFDPDRSTQGHLAFGHGIHFCMGAPLARLEARIALRSLLERCPDLALDGVPGPWLPGMLVRGVRNLPVKW
ncbi:cytochrome P450 family protein [Streptomyces indicus]|uniref:Cytochrome P450 n=1 Tax=Streptomyces indicus TaxID=417292 RepID=A0A1G8UY09_9ACTN|nr:cytochrome P450 [Streptomyces indicus]SDJ58457.1 Cytochrome P450 [Streptomyces indicus]